MATYRITERSVLRATAPEVWAHATSMAGINAELRPYLRMTAPPGIEVLDERTVQPGQPLGRSVLLLFGLLPIDRMDLMLVELEPGRRFVEQSQVLSQRLWRHERTVAPDGDGCVLSDEITFTPRAAGPVVNAFLRAMFKNRHRVLRRKFA